MQSILLLTTTTCPRCPAMKAAVRELEGVNIQIMDETDKFFMKTCKDFDVTAAPVAILFDEKMIEIGRATEDYELQDLLK